MRSWDLGHLHVFFVVLGRHSSTHNGNIRNVWEVKEDAGVVASDTRLRNLGLVVKAPEIPGSLQAEE